MLTLCTLTSSVFSAGAGSVLHSKLLPFAASFPLVPGFFEAAAAEAAAGVLAVAPDFGEAFSVDNSVLLFGFGPDLAATAEDCLEGAGEGFVDLALGLAEAPAAEVGFVIFFLGASVAVLSAAEGFELSLLSSFLGEAGFFREEPCLAMWSGVPLPLFSALAPAPPADVFSPLLTLPLSLTLDLLVGLLVFDVSDF